jgi:hypothetical protein
VVEGGQHELALLSMRLARGSDDAISGYRPCLLEMNAPLEIRRLVHQDLVQQRVIIYQVRTAGTEPYPNYGPERPGLLEEG